MAATEVNLPDTIRIKAQQRVIIPVAGTLPNLGELVATIRFTPGVVAIGSIRGNQSYALTCPSFGMVQTSLTRSTGIIQATCGSAGAGIHDKLFDVDIEGVLSPDATGSIEIVSLMLDNKPLPIVSAPCVIIREDTVDGAASARTRVTGNYPNPFSTSTRLAYSVATDQAVTINVRSIQGRLVRSFADIAAHAGENEYVMNFQESDVGSGRYIVELITKEGTLYHGMAVMR
jgi:hypothetical protein